MSHLITIFIIICSHTLAGVIWLGLVMLGTYIKSKILEMNEVKWDAYFNNMNPNTLLMKIGITYIFALTISSYLAYLIFVNLQRENTFILAGATFILGVLTSGYKAIKGKNELITKMKGFTNTNHITNGF